MLTTGLSEAGRFSRAATRSRATFAICVLAACCFGLTQSSNASASQMSFTWSGTSTLTENWSDSANWEGNDLTPTDGEEVGSLTFPRLTSTACIDERASHPCYFSYNDLTGLSATSMQLDDGNSYFIEGEALTLGSSGLTASPASGTSGPAGDFIELPLRLGAPQKWRISDRSDGAIEENGVFLGGELSGSGRALTAELANGAALILENDTEVGPVTIEGPNAAGEHISNGSVLLEDGALNAADGQSVDLRNIFFAGIGTVGSLTTDNSTVDVGSGDEPAEGLEASTVKLDPSSAVLFEITGTGTAAQTSYSQLTAKGSVALAGSIGVEVAKPTASEPCPSLSQGATYTFISTTGSLSGAFANAPEGGPEIPISSAIDCSKTSQTMLVSYSRSGSVETVTGTVEAEAIRQRQEAFEAQTKKVAEEAADAEAAAKKHQEEEAASAAAKKHQEEEAAKDGVLGTKEVAPDATIVSTSLQASASGAVSVRISCPAGESSCAGIVTLRALNAVGADLFAASAKASVLTLAAGSFSIPGGAEKTITLHLSAKAQKLLRHSHLLRVRATVVAHNPAGATHVGQTVATLRLHRTERGKG